MVGLIIFAILITVVMVILDKRAESNGDLQECFDDDKNEADNIELQQNSNKQSNENYFVAITASILFPFTGIPHLILLLCCNNEKTKSIIYVLEIINIIVLSIMALLLVGFLILFGSCLVALSHH